MIAVYQVEEEDEALMKYQYSHTDGKAFQTTKGKPVFTLPFWLPQALLICMSASYFFQSIFL